MSKANPVQTFVAGGVQHSHRTPEEVDHPARMMARGGLEALSDAGITDLELVDALACVEPFSWGYKDLGRTVAGDMGLSEDIEHVWVPAGGTSPQDLLHKIGQKISAGEIDCAVICGAESMRTMRRALKSGHNLDWPDRTDAANPMRDQRSFSSELEQRHGLSRPIQLFPLIENALRTANGRSASEQIEVATTILARNAAVAKSNVHEWFRDAPTADELGNVTADNRMIVYPYTKRMNAIMDVDQSAAIVIVSDTFLEKHGLTPRSAAVLGGAGAEEIWNPIEREDLSKCPAMELSIQQALARSGLTAGDIDAMDLYSCFPSAVQLGLQALGASTEDERPLSLTGGLAFAGGPGNAYVLHALVSALERIRKSNHAKLLVTGIGMANTKHAATILSSADHIPAEATGKLVYREANPARPVKVIERAGGEARIATYTIEYERDGTPSNIVLLLDLKGGGRTIANMADVPRAAEELLSMDPIGRSGQVHHDESVDCNFFAFPTN